MFSCTHVAAAAVDSSAASSESKTLIVARTPPPASTTQYPWNPGASRSCGANSSTARRATSAVSVTPWYLRMTVCIAPPQHGDRSRRPSSPRAGKSSARERPEVAGEAKALEDGHVLLTRARNPVGRKTVVPPGVRELRKLRHRDGRAGRPTAEPAGDVLLRPEEIHRASGEDDVVPPVRRGDEAVEEERLVVRALVAHLDDDRLAAVRARSLDPAVRVECRADAERVPGAVAVPPAPACLDAVRGRHDRERVEHSQLVGGRIENDCMLRVKT